MSSKLSACRAKCRIGTVVLIDVPVVVVQYLGVHRAVSFVVCVDLKNENFMETTNQSIPECFLDETTQKILSIYKEKSFKIL